jgi:hypothetical protein
VGIIIGAVIGGVILLVLVAAAWWFFVTRKRRGERMANEEATNGQGDKPSPQPDPVELHEQVKPAEMAGGSANDRAKPQPVHEMDGGPVNAS